MGREERRDEALRILGLPSSSLRSAPRPSVRTEVSAVYVNNQYTRMFSLSLRSSLARSHLLELLGDVFEEGAPPRGHAEGGDVVSLASGLLPRAEDEAGVERLPRLRCRRRRIPRDDKVVERPGGLDSAHVRSDVLRSGVGQERRAVVVVVGVQTVPENAPFKSPGTFVPPPLNNLRIRAKNAAAATGDKKASSNERRRAARNSARF